MGHVFPELRAKQDHVEQVIQREEEAFNKTLDTGTDRSDVEYAGLVATSLLPAGANNWELQVELIGKLNEGGREGVEAYARERNPAWRIQDVPPLSAKAAFELYDTYGFPLDLTELMARERGLTVDVAGFNKLMEEQKARARAAQKKQVIELSQVETTTPTQFVGYDKLEAPAKVLEVVGSEGQDRRHPRHLATLRRDGRPGRRHRRTRTRRRALARGQHAESRRRLAALPGADD